MQKIIKITLIALSLMVVLLITAAIIFTLTFDPNAYKKEITQAVKQSTGRTLEIDGNIRLSYFPWLGVKLDKVSLSNARGFGNKPFAKMDSAGVTVKILPLLTSNIVVKRLSLNQLTLNLAVNKNGKNNWQDLSGDSKTNTQPSSLPDITIGGIAVNNATIDYRDSKSNSRYTLSKLNITTGTVTFGQAVDTDIDFVLQHGKRNIPVNLDTTLKFDLQKETVDLSKLRLTIDDMSLSGAVQGRDLFSKPKVSGTIKAASFNLTKLLQQFGQGIKTADKKTMSHVSINSQFAYGGGRLRLKPFAMVLDDTKVKGRVTVNTNNNEVNFDLSLDDINVDRYLPPDDGKSSAGGVLVTSKDVRTLNGISGKLAVGKMQALGIKSQQVHTSIKASNNTLVIGPSKAKLYGGHYRGKVIINATGNTPVITMNETVSSVNLAPLLRDTLGNNQISGTGTVKLAVTGKGKTANAILGSLNGHMTLSARNGKIKGIDLKKIATYLVSLGDKIRFKKPRIKRKRGDETVFKSLTMTATIKNGLTTTNDLTLKGPNLVADGKGTVHIVTEKLKMKVNADLIEDETKKHAAFPLVIGGTISDPKPKLDFSKLLKGYKKKDKAENKQKTEKKKKDAKEKWKKKKKKWKEKYGL